jgi:structure-specific recognition protein 1
MSIMLRNIAKVNIIVPSGFESNSALKYIKCSVKASDGSLYPMKNSLVFYYKPVMYIKHSEIKYVEFSRVGDIASGQNRSFDITIHRNGEGQEISFVGVDKNEHKCL